MVTTLLEVTEIIPKRPYR